MGRRYETELKTLRQLITEASTSKGATYYANKNSGRKKRIQKLPCKISKRKRNKSEKKNTLVTLGTNLFLSTEKIVKNYFQLLTEKGF